MSNHTNSDHSGDSLLRDGLAIIYARSLNHCIGIDGGLPWSLPDEYAHFNATTVGSPVIMGRRSFEDHEGALPGRLNIVVSRDKEYAVSDDILLASSLAQAIQLAAAAHTTYFVIGGAGLISEALPLADTVFETVIDADIEGDTFLSPMDFSDWSTKLLDEHSIDGQHPFEFQLYRHTR